MKTKKILSIIVATIILCSTVLYIGLVVASAAGGDNDDPIVSKSYVDAQIAALESKMNGQNTAQTNALNAAQAANNNKFITNSTAQSIATAAANSAVNAYAASQPSGNYGYKVVTLKKGSVLSGNEGLEFILRNGSAKLNSDSSSVGVYDMTSGAFVGNSGELTANHYFILQREGRSVQAVLDCEVLVRGVYKIS